eukprot:gene7227-11542_t
MSNHKLNAIIKEYLRSNNFEETLASFKKEEEAVQENFQREQEEVNVKNLETLYEEYIVLKKEQKKKDDFISTFNNPVSNQMVNNMMSSMYNLIEVYNKTILNPQQNVQHRSTTPTQNLIPQNLIPHKIQPKPLTKKPNTSTIENSKKSQKKNPLPVGKMAPNLNSIPNTNQNSSLHLNSTLNTNSKQVKQTTPTLQSKPFLQQTPKQLLPRKQQQKKDAPSQKTTSEYKESVVLPTSIQNKENFKPKEEEISPIKPMSNNNSLTQKQYDEIINLDSSVGLEDILNHNIFLTPESKKRDRDHNHNENDFKLMYTPTVEDLFDKEEVKQNPNKKCRVNLESTAFESVRVNIVKLTIN